MDPLLGGINAGNADNLSITAGARVPWQTQPAEADRSSSALREQRASAAPGPVFHGVKGGTQRVIDALHDELSDHIHLNTPAVSLERHGQTWRVTTPSGHFDGDRVIITTPGFISAALLEPHAPEAASLLAGLAYSDAVLVTFVVPSEQVGHSLDGAGFLVPRDQGLLMTACSWSSSKWNHYDDGSHAILRVSAGRVDDRRWLDLDESALVNTLRQELALTIGLQGEGVVRVTPWRQSFPQYLPGHLERCDQIDANLAARHPRRHRRRSFYARPRPPRLRPPSPHRHHPTFLNRCPRLVWRISVSVVRRCAGRRRRLDR